MSITQAIQTARSGLQVSGLRADVVANNVANATTPGYLRRSLDVSELTLGASSGGVQSNGIVRTLDSATTTNRRDISSDQASASVLASAWENLSGKIGNTTDGAGLFSSLSSLENALVDAASTPESTTGLVTLFSTSEAVAAEFKDVSDHISALRSEADQEIAIGVDRINSALKQIEDLNKSLAGMDRTTNEAAALFDQRSRVLDTIAEYVPVQALERENGVIDVVTKQGVSLVAGSAREIEFTQSFNFGAGQTLANGDLSGLSVNGIDLTPGASTHSAVSSGMFGALFQLRDRDLPEFTEQLDSLATDLVARMSDESIDPTTAAGEAGIFIDSSSVGGPGIAGRLVVNSAVDPNNGGAVWRFRDGINATAEGPPGNSAILDRLVSAFTDREPLNVGQLQGQFSAVESAAELSSLAGYRQVTLEAINSSTQTQLNALRDAETTNTGVDIDNQMQDLLIIEQAYAANARVIQTASQMLDRLMEL